MTDSKQAKGIVFELSPEQHARLIAARGESTVVGVLGREGGAPTGCAPEVALALEEVWSDLGAELGFDPLSARPAPGKGTRFFVAVPNGAPFATTRAPDELGALPGSDSLGLEAAGEEREDRP